MPEVTGSTEKADLFKYSSVQRISKIPVVESGYNYVTGIYTRVKNCNGLVRWSLGNVEGGIQLAVDKTMPTVLLLDLPLTLVDSIICKGLDTVSIAVPAINYPPDQIVSMSKDYVNCNLIGPVLKRADSVKQLGLSEATRVGEMAATRLDTALDFADKYVDRYLPDSTDSTDSKKAENSEEGESKTSHAIHHMNRLGKKLQRRLTRRTLMEAEALKKGGQDLAHTVLCLADLLLRDPSGFGDKMKELWMKFSEDEPENQVPPANMEQLVGLLTRETTRRVVHGINFVVSTLPAQSAHAFRFSLHYLQTYANYFLKVVHLEGAKGIAFATSSQRLAQLRSFVLNLLEVLGSRIKDSKNNAESLKLSESSEINANISEIPSHNPVSSSTSSASGEAEAAPAKPRSKSKGKPPRKLSKESTQSSVSGSSAEQQYSTPSSELDESSSSSTLEASLSVTSTPYQSPQM